MKEIKIPLLDPKRLNNELKLMDFRINIVDSCPSTNDELKKQIDSLRHKTVLLTEEQTAGKGRQNRQFISNKSKGIYCSLLWKMKFDPQQVRWFSLMSSFAIGDALRKQTGLDIQIKWPNDLYINKKKCAGILIESEISSDQKDISLVCGFGINVYHQVFNNELDTKVTSIEDHYDKGLDRNDLIIEILKSLNHYLSRPYTQASKTLYEKYLILPNTFLNIEHHGMVFKAKLNGINEDGYMECIKENGEHMVLSVEEIHFV